MNPKYKDYYKILGVDETATLEEIKIAYKKLAIQYHPDLNSGDPEKEEKFKEIGEAYNILSNPESRAKYDFLRKYGSLVDDKGDTLLNFYKFPFNIIIEAITNIFENELPIKKINDLFYNRFGFKVIPETPRPKDIKKEIEIEFIEACFGTKKEIEVKVIRQCKGCNGKGKKLQTTTGDFCNKCQGTGELKLSLLSLKIICPECHGSGRKNQTCPECYGSGEVEKEIKYELEIAPSVEDGDIKIIKGGGNCFKDDPIPGDLYLTIRIKEHPYFIRKGNDIYCKLRIPFTIAILGGEVKVPTIYGDVKLKILPGTQSGQTYRLKDKGIPYSNKQLKGDQYIIIEISIPVKLSPEEKEIIAKLSKYYSNNIELLKPNKDELR